MFAAISSLSFPELAVARGRSRRPGGQLGPFGHGREKITDSLFGLAVRPRGDLFGRFAHGPHHSGGA